MNVRLTGVHKYYPSPAGPCKVLENVNLHIPSGGFVSIMGPSGSGKTTLLNLVGCLDTPTFGQVMLEDRDVATADESARERIRLHHIGLVFQNYNLLPTLTVLENVLLPMQLASVRRSEQEERGLTLLKAVGLDQRAGQRVSSLSGGQQQRVAMARALGNLPRLVLADEPTGNLDGRASREVMEVLKSINDTQRVTVILVTHDPAVAAYAEQVYYLEDGRINTT
ncbi:MAG: ABC transporter ATP-binding protein [Candidatus Eremiobacterota bacterium]